jgi:AraC-like DNA-binding protein
LSSAPFSGEIRFAHCRPTDVSEHQRIFGAVVHFAHPESEIVFDSAYLQLPISAADEELLGVLEQYAERLLRRIRPAQNWSAKVTELLSRTLCDGKPSLSQVAKLLALSQRSLQTKLKEEGTTYQALLDSVRQQLATAYLRDDKLSLAEISYLIGFADQSAFNHAFRKWTGDSPLRFRGRSEP